VTGRNKVIVRIAGKEYTVVGVEAEEHIQKVGFYIDKKMNEIMRGNNKLSTSLAAVLTAINVADDFVKISESEARYKSEISRLQEELRLLREEKKELSQENTALTSTNSGLQLELAKREAELREVRNSLEKAAHRGNNNR
jgi:cell division protein ZapA